MFDMDKKEFMYRCSMQAMQGSFANSSTQSSPARIVREAEKLWEELQEWERNQGMNGNGAGNDA